VMVMLRVSTVLEGRAMIKAGLRPGDDRVLTLFLTWVNNNPGFLPRFRRV
jgi:hypothetical protein